MSKPAPATVPLTDHLKALLLGGAVVAAGVQSASATSAPIPTTDAQKELSTRIEDARRHIANEQGLVTGNRTGESADPDLMWWRNYWHNFRNW